MNKNTEQVKNKKWGRQLVWKMQIQVDIGKNKRKSRKGRLGSKQLMGRLWKCWSASLYSLPGGAAAFSVLAFGPFHSPTWLDCARDIPEVCTLRGRIVVLDKAEKVACWRQRACEASKNICCTARAVVVVGDDHWQAQSSAVIAVFLGWS